jgi:hypothetical protein
VATWARPVEVLCQYGTRQLLWAGIVARGDRIRWELRSLNQWTSRRVNSYGLPVGPLLVSFDLSEKPPVNEDGARREPWKRVEVVVTSQGWRAPRPTDEGLLWTSLCFLSGYPSHHVPDKDNNEKEGPNTTTNCPAEACWVGRRDSAVN